MKHLKERKIYRNCYSGKKFTVCDIKKKENTCVILYENKDPKNSSYDIIRDLVNKSIELKKPGYEINLNTKGAEWYAIIQYIKSRCNHPDNKMQELITNLRKRYYGDRTIPEEWRTDIDLMEQAKEKLQDGLSKNFWIYTLPDKVKGTLMQRLYFSFMELLGKNVSKNINQDYDVGVEGRRKEVKMSTISNGKLQFFNIRQFQEWDDLVFIVILPNELYIYEKSKSEFIDFLEKNPDCQNWAGGKEKKLRLNGDIRINDYFHFGANLDILGRNFGKIYPL